jgi:hypothetical protein
MDALVKWTMQSDLTRIRPGEKINEKSLRMRSLGAMVLDRRVAHWCDPDIKENQIEKRNNFKNGPCCPMNIKSENSR